MCFTLTETLSTTAGNSISEEKFFVTKLSKFRVKSNERNKKII